MSDSSDLIPLVSAWCESHPGLGGWVGALGAVLAIFVTWGLSRSEYQRARRGSIDQKIRQLDMLRGIINLGAEIVVNYQVCAKNGADEARAFYHDSQSNPRLTIMTELYSLPLVSWPNPMLALVYRPYWEASTKLLESWRDNTLSQGAVKSLIGSCEEKWKHLTECLDSEAGYIKRSDAF